MKPRPILPAEKSVSSRGQTNAASAKETETRKAPVAPGSSSSAATGTPRVLLVDDHPVVRRGMAEVLREKFKNATIGEADSAQAALDQVWATPWDVIILDVSLPGRGGLDLLKELKQELPKIPVLILSTHPEDQFAVRSLKSGAVGYLTKESAATELVVAVEKVLAGGKYIRPSVAEQLASHVNVSAEKPLHHTLSNREFQILCMIAYGMTVKEIGGELSLSVKTISTYRSRILAKMMMKNNAELMHYAMQNDLVRLGGTHPPSDEP
jgi:two-component system, NarL family, invasion response regulator UvrY